MSALERFTDAFDGPPSVGSRRRLSLVRIRDRARRLQFAGDGTRAHPPLYDRDVLAFLPFQVSHRRFVIPVYVMTRNLTRTYGRNRTGLSRLDLPAERYELTIGGLRSCRLRASLLDPLTGARPPVRIRSCRRGRVVVDLPVTDSPRLLALEER